MGKGSYLLIGAAFGALVAVTINYFFGPATNTTFDENYRSRLDYALDEGRRAALKEEADLRKQFETLRQLPNNPPQQP